MKPNAAIAIPHPAAAIATASPCAHVRDPAGCERRRERAGVRRRVHVADERRVAVLVRRDRREERHRHPEDHRVDVDEHEPEHDGLPDDVAEAVGDRAQARPVGIRDRRDLRQRKMLADPGDERDEVERVRRREPDRADQHAAERRTGDRRERAEMLSSTMRGRQLFAGTSRGVIERMPLTPRQKNDAEKNARTKHAHTCGSGERRR